MQTYMNVSYKTHDSSLYKLEVKLVESVSEKDARLIDLVPSH